VSLGREKFLHKKYLCFPNATAFGRYFIAFFVGWGRGGGAEIFSQIINLYQMRHHLVAVSIFGEARSPVKFRENNAKCLF
jgi:hypothetical protein